MAVAEKRTANGTDNPSPTFRVVFSASPEAELEPDPDTPTPIGPPEFREPLPLEKVVVSLAALVLVVDMEVDGVWVNRSVPVPTGG